MDNESRPTRSDSLASGFHGTGYIAPPNTRVTPSAATSNASPALSIVNEQLIDLDAFPPFEDHLSGIDSAIDHSSAVEPHALHSPNDLATLALRHTSTSPSTDVPTSTAGVRESSDWAEDVELALERAFASLRRLAEDDAQRDIETGGTASIISATRIEHHMLTRLRHMQKKIPALGQLQLYVAAESRRIEVLEEKVEEVLKMVGDVKGLVEGVVKDVRAGFGVEGEGLERSTTLTKLSGMGDEEFAGGHGVEE